MAIENSLNKTYYNKRAWLNPEDSPSTGSIVCYDGIVEGEKRSYIEIGDCYGKIKLHKAEYDTPEDFVRKLIVMRENLSNFIDHLIEKQYPEEDVDMDLTIKDI